MLRLKHRVFKRWPWPRRLLCDSSLSNSNFLTENHEHRKPKPTCRVRSRAEAWGMVLYICPSIWLSCETMGAKLCSSVLTDFSKMAHTAWGAHVESIQPTCEPTEVGTMSPKSSVGAGEGRRRWRTSTTCESFSHLPSTVWMRANTCCRTTTTCWHTNVPQSFHCQKQKRGKKNN